MRRVVEYAVNEIAVVVNVEAGVEQMDQGNVRRAESLFRVAISEAKNEKTGSIPQARMEAIYRLGELSRRSGRLDEAETLLGEASENWRKTPPLISTATDIDIARALTLDAKGMSPRSAKALADIAGWLSAERADLVTGAIARFPELQPAFKRYVPYCLSHQLGCEGSFEMFLNRRL
jgi:hypothetical protein